MLLLHSHIDVHAGYRLTQWITDAAKTSLTNSCTSHFIVRVRKGLLKVCVWEGAGDRTETAIFWPLLLWSSALCLSCSPDAQPEALGPLCWVMAFFTASYQQLLWFPNSIGVPEDPLGRVCLSQPHLVYNSVSNCNCNSNWLDFCLD